jgi:predicted dienelactone hydrolase
MRPLELVLFLGCFLLLFPYPKRWHRPALFAVSGVTDAALVAHLLLEGYRWQMVPAYVLCQALVAFRFLSFRRAPREWLALVGRGVGFVAVLLALAPPLAFPVPVFPKPGGPYAVGTVTFHWTDSARAEAYNPDAADPAARRELMVQLWYPARPAAGQAPAPWMDRLDIVGPTIATYLKLPPFFLDHARLVKTNSYAAAPADPAGGRYPVIVYSHGWNGFRTVNQNQSEALASHGYVVAAVDHTYAAMVTVFDDGRVALNNPALLPDGPQDAAYFRAAGEVEATFAADVSFVLDQLARVDSGEIASPLAGRLDLERAGLYGHSTGGGAVVVACQLDARCRAGLGLDAWLEPLSEAAMGTPLARPFLFMRSEVWASGENDARLERLVAGRAAPAYTLTVLGTRHYDFTLMPLLTPLAPALGLKGPLEGRRAMAVISDYLVAFFDHYLKGTHQPLLDGPSDEYPEVAFERFE